MCDGNASEEVIYQSQAIAPATMAYHRTSAAAKLDTE